MGRNALKTIERNFVKGRLSEFTGLNFPENSCVDESNCVFDSRGYVTRRPGLQMESSGNTFTLDGSGAASKYVWKNAGQTTNTTFMVVQKGASVGFFRVNALGNAESLQYTLDLSDYATSTSVGVSVCSYAQGDGYLFISNAGMEPVYVDYDEDSGSFTVASITVQVRDTDGLPDATMDALAADVRPTSLTNTHKYNLFNQGWWDRDVFGHNGHFYTPLAGWDYYNTDFPSNSDIWWSFRILMGLPTNREEYVPNATVMALTEPRSNGPAPRGHYILNAFYQDRTNVSGISGLTTTSSGTARPSCIAFFAGRVFYAGVNAPGYGQTVYFSKIIEGKKDYGKCYQVNDPTIEEGTDLLDSDGGTIRILEMGIPVAFFNLKDSLLIFCNNGIWAISGSTGTGFKATDYSVQKISGVGALSPLSIVNVEGSPVWWNSDGIYSLAANQAGSFEAQSMTKPSIQTFYNDIATAAKRYAMGDYNPIEKRVIWLYGTGDFIQPVPDTADVIVSISGAFNYESALVLDVTTGAFYTWTFDTVIAQLRGILCLDAQGANEQQETVTVGGVDVTVSSSTVTVDIIVVLDVSSRFKYITEDDGGDLLFCEMTNVDTWVDWEDINIPDGGYDYESYFTTAYKVHADGDKAFNAHWVTIFSEFYPGGDSDDSAFLQARWDWSTGSASGRWSVEQQVYPPNASILNSTFHRRLKMRGSGPALQLHFRGVSGKPFRISGWSTMETAADSVSR